jgi:hypothetical protein
MITIIKTQNNPHQKQKKIQTLTKSNTNHYIHHSKNTKKIKRVTKKNNKNTSNAVMIGATRNSTSKDRRRVREGF